MQRQNLLVPISIVIAGMIIAGTVFYTRGNNGAKNDATAVSTKDDTPKQDQKNPDFANPKAISEIDHVIGDPNAPMTVFLYDDFECPYCKLFHQTIKQMIDEYGKQGKIKLVFRHFPLETRHKTARTEAEASECVANLGGTGAFWKFADKIFETTASNDGLDLGILPQIAVYAGVNKIKFTDCLAGKNFSDYVQANIEDGMNVGAGAQGTPFFVFVNAQGEKYADAGHMTYPQFKLMIESALSGKLFGR